MANAKITYAPELRESEHGRRLYRYWKIVRHETDSQDFVEYPDFFKWAMANGYTLGAKLLRYAAEEPYSPDNCFWVARSEPVNEGAENHRDREWEQKWDEAVNRIRTHFGMEPIHSSEV